LRIRRFIQSTITLCTTAALLTALPPSAHAEPGVVCTVEGTSLTITIDATATQVMLSHTSGHMIVAFGNYHPLCTNNGVPIDQASLTSIDLRQQNGTLPVHWEVMVTDWVPLVTVHNSAQDSMAVVGGDTVDRITVIPGAPGSMSFDSSPDAELTLATEPTGTRLSTLAGNDIITLSVATGQWEGPTVIDSGAGSDTVTGGAGSDWIHPGAGADAVTGAGGNDRVDVDPDLEADVVRGGGGSDELHLSALNAVGAVVNPANPGGDGVYRNDDYADFDLYLGSSGNDMFIAPPSGMVATGESGDDIFVPGTGDDTFYGGSLNFRDYAWLNDTVVFTSAPQSVTVTPVGTHDVVSGHGNDQLFEIATIVGSNYDDVLSSATAFQLRPGLGDDQLAFKTGGTVYAESYPDGSDSVTTSAGHVSWDYHTRSTPLAMSADGVANDGDPGEQDNISGATGVAISGGSADDVITGVAVRTASTAVEGTTGSPAAAATTRCRATPETTCSRAGSEPTR